MKILAMKLVTGEDVIAAISAEDDDNLYLDYPYALPVKHRPADQFNAKVVSIEKSPRYLEPWFAVSATRVDMPLPRRSILISVTPTKDVLDLYQRTISAIPKTEQAVS